MVARIKAQDEALLDAIVPLRDGRDYIVLRRLYVRQTYLEALQEREAFLRVMAKFPKQHDPATRREPVSMTRVPGRS